MAIGILTLDIQIPGCLTLKEKRSHVKPLLYRLHREFNVSIAETDYCNRKSEAIITVVMVSSDSKYLQSMLNHVVGFIKHHYSNLEIVGNSIEIT